MATQRIGWAYCTSCASTYRLRHTCDPARVAEIAARRAAAAEQRAVICDCADTAAALRAAAARDAERRDIVTRNLRRTITQLPMPADYARAADGVDHAR